MKTFLVLLRWQLRQLFWVTAVAVICMMLFVMFSSAPLMRLSQNVSLIIGVAVHCGVMVLMLGRSSPRGPGFLYAQGFSRDQLWWSIVAATVFDGLTVCFAYWLTIVGGLRSATQSAIDNPWFPVAGTIEASTAGWLFLEYVLLLPPLHYVWVRVRQPQRDPSAGWVLAVGIILFYSCCLGSLGQSPADSMAIPIIACSLPATLTLIAGWIFHRQTEVQS
jgi:hypothetical protein